VSWVFDGDGSDIWFDVSGSGHVRTCAMGSQLANPAHGDKSWVRNVQQMAGGWYLCGLAELEDSKDRQHQKLIEFYHGNRKKAAGLLSYGDAGGFAPPLISCTIIADRTYCESVNSICRTIFGRKDCKYILTAEFSGFIDEGMPALPNIPTFKQFKDTDQPEHIFLSSEIRFSFTST
jgi:hypothetical protein